MGNGASVVDKGAGTTVENIKSPLLLEFLTKNSVSKSDYDKYNELFVSLTNQGMENEAILLALTNKLSDETDDNFSYPKACFRCDTCKAEFVLIGQLQRHLFENKSHAGRSETQFQSMNLDSYHSESRTSHVGSDTGNVGSLQKHPSSGPPLSQSNSRRPSFERRRSFESLSSVNQDLKQPTKMASSTSALACLHSEVERTTNLLASYFALHPREHSESQEGVIFQGKKMMKLRENSNAETVGILVSLIPGPTLTVCDIPEVVEIVITTTQKKPHMTGKHYLCYRTMKELLASELSKTTDVSRQHIIVAQYCVSRLQVSHADDTQFLSVSIKHDTFSAGNSIEKKLEGLARKVNAHAPSNLLN